MLYASGWVPGSTLEWRIDWRAETLAFGEDIASSTLTAVGLDLGDFVETTDYVEFFVAGGLPGVAASVRNEIVTTLGRHYVETVVFALAEPVSVDEARARCRLGNDRSRDVEIAGFIAAARAKVESYTGLVLTPREVLETIRVGRGGGGVAQLDYISGRSFKAFGVGSSVNYLRFTAWPVNEAPVVEYQEAGAGWVEIEGTRYLEAGRPAFIYAPADGWPSIADPYALRVRAPCGWTRAQIDVEAPQLITAILMLVVRWFDSPDGMTAGAAGPLPVGVQALCWDFRLPGV